MLMAKETVGQLFERVTINSQVPHVSANDGKKP